MADETDTRLESALKCIENTAEVGGYLKKETCKDIQEAVSVIRSCFTEMKTALENSSNEMMKLQNEVKENDTGDIAVVKDSRLMGQVAPSTDATPEAPEGEQPTPPPSAQDSNHVLRVTSEYDNSGEENKTHEQATSNEQRRNQCTDTQLEAKITETITRHLQTMVETLSKNMKIMIREEIRNTGTADKPIKATPKEPTNIDGNQGIINDTNTAAEAKRQTTDRNDTSESEEEEYEEVVNRRKRRRQRRTETLVGTLIDNEVQAGQQTAWLYIGRLSQQVTVDKIKNFIRRKNIEGNITCEELTTRGDNKAFKLGIPMKYLANANDPAFWPQGVIVRRFRFRFPQRSDDRWNRGADL